MKKLGIALACRANRKVTLYKKPYAYEEGETEAVGTDKTDASGNWTIQGAFIAGLYYARVANALVPRQRRTDPLQRRPDPHHALLSFG